MQVHELLACIAGRDAFSILLFHRVTDQIPPDGLTVSTAWFRRFCALMRDRFHVVSLADACEGLRAGERPRRRTVVLTFDDCYGDNLDAARTLAEFGLPATFFLPSHLVETNHVLPWDRHLPPMSNLTWDDVRRIVALGHEIGSHTAHHVDLGAIGPDKARFEMEDSKRRIEDRLSRPVRYLAYPFGQRCHFKPEYLPLAKELGYEAVLSGFGGAVWPHMKDTILPREPAPSFPSLLNLELHLAGCLDWIYSVKRKLGIIRTETP
jgi:peptidoglycan/xylan/chitin deacetylase (PgdA/CDA1 family)